MRRGYLLGGLLVSLLGLALIGVGYSVNLQGTTRSVPAGQAVGIATSWSLGSVDGAFRWSGAPENSTVYLFTGVPGVGGPACPSPRGVIAYGTGSSGSFGATLSGSAQYFLLACGSTGAPVGATFTFSLEGVTYLVLVGIVLAIAGAFVLVAGARRKP